MTTTTVQQVIDFVASRASNVPLSPEQVTQFLSELKQVVADISVTVPNAASGAVTLAYSGTLGTGADGKSLYAWQLAEGIGQNSNGQVLTIGQTEAGKLLNSRDFENALLEVVGGDKTLRDAILNGSVDSNGNRLPDGLGDYLSERFVSAAAGEVRTLTPFADPTRVFSQTELPALLSNPNVTHIDGLSKDYLLRYKGELVAQGLGESQALEKVRATVSAASFENYAKLQFALDAEGNIGRNAAGGLGAVGTYGFFEGTPVIGSSLPDAVPRKSAAEVIGTLPDTHLKTLSEGAAGLKTLRQYAAEIGDTRMLNKLGVLGDVLGVLLAANEANAAYEAGDATRARSILAHWATDFAGGGGGGLAAAELVGSALAPLYCTGPAGSLLAGGLTLLAGVAGGMYGGSFATGIADVFSSARAWTPPRVDPLALDLDGDGIETVGINGYGTILFDHDGDGLKQGTGWVKPDDGLLVLDRNGNGLIDNGSELFGVDTVLSGGQKATDGFAALRDLDANGDGKFDAADAQFGNVRVWRDSNQDGISQANELTSLADTAIVSISLNAATTSGNPGNGNTITHTAAYTRADGTTGTAANLNFAQNAFYREFTDPVVRTDQANTLPDMHGSGGVRDLREAASLSSDLASGLASYAAENTRFGQIARLDGLLLAWSKTSTFVTSAVRASGTSGITFQGIADGSPEYQQWLDKLSVLERFNGQTFRDTGSFTVQAGAMTLLNQGYQDLKSSVYQSLALQTRLKPYLDAVKLKADPTTGAISLDFTALDAKLESRYASDPGAALIDLYELHRFAASSLTASWNGFHTLQGWVMTASVDAALQPVLTELNIKTASGTLTGTGTGEYLFGQSGNDTLNGNDGDDWLSGGAGSDSLFGGNGNDTLHGGAGNDYLNGGAGNDTYVFGKGAGQDTLYNYDTSAGKNDVIEFGADVAVTEVRASRSSDDLILNIVSTGDRLVVQSYFNSDAAGAYKIERIAFADGTTWDVAAVKALTTAGTSGADTLYGYATGDTLDGLDGNDSLYGRGGDDSLAGGSGADSIYGEDGQDGMSGGTGADFLGGGNGDDTLGGGADNDTLYGDAGNDRLDGGAGNDYLNGGAGNDTYVFGKGAGQDTVYDYDTTAGNSDKLEFGAAVSANQIWFRHVGCDLEVSIIGSGDKTTISNWYSGSYYRVEQIQTADGKILMDTQVENLVSAMAAFSPPAAGQTALPQNYLDTLAPVLAASWK